jgi:hypothetical protein
MCNIDVGFAVGFHPDLEIPEVLPPIQVRIHQRTVALCGASGDFIEERQVVWRDGERANSLPKHEPGERRFGQDVTQ